MAKKDKKKNKQKGSEAADAVEAVRSAVERTFQATTEGAGATQKRTRALVDEIAHAATRVRETIEDLKILEDVRGLRTEIEALARRVTALENRTNAPSRPAPAKRTTAKSKPTVKTRAKTPAKTRAKAKSKPRAKRAASTTS